MNILQYTLTTTGNLNNLFKLCQQNVNLDLDSEISESMSINSKNIQSDKENFIITQQQPISIFKTLTGQNKFDLTCQYYGQLDNLFDFLTDNIFDISTAIQPGMILKINNYLKGNEKNKTEIIKNRLIFCNQEIENVLSEYVLGTEDNKIITTEDGQELEIDL